MLVEHKSFNTLHAKNKEESGIVGVFKCLKCERIDPLSRIIITAQMIRLSNLGTIPCFLFKADLLSSLPVYSNPTLFYIPEKKTT